MVIVLKGKDPYQTAREALGKFPLPNVRGKKILIKPNAARLALPGRGITTHPQVVGATIDHLREGGVKDIVVGESCIFGIDAQEAFRATGMQEVCGQRETPLVDLDRLEPMDIPVPAGRLIKKIKVPSLLREIDFLISIPVMKTHMHTGVSLSLKNMKGLLWRKEKARFHHLRGDERVTRGEKELDIAISEMASVLIPHLAIIDGTVGMEGMGPAYGNPKKAGMIVVGDNAVSADAVATRLMGLNPEGIPHLKLCAEKGLGKIRLKEIKVDPKDYLEWAVPFERPPSKLSIPFPEVAVHDEGSCSACLSTLLLFLQDHRSRLTDYRLSDGQIHVGIGRHLSACPKGTILIGNCTSKLRRKGPFIHGCPPVSSQILKVLKASSQTTSSSKKRSQGT